MITVSKEDYLKAILEAESEGETVISATLAHWLVGFAAGGHHGVAPPEERWPGPGAGRRRGQPDPAGRKIARKLTLRHHLIERMLAEMFGMEWYKVHDEAERLEHAVSPDFEAKLLARLGRGGACPHGNLSELESPDQPAAPRVAAAGARRGGSQLSWSAAFTSATAVCWNFWSSAVSAPARACMFPGEITTTL